MAIRISKEFFMVYEDIRKGGQTNMLDIKRVVELSNGLLDEWKVRYIIKNYHKLASEYL